MAVRSRTALINNITAARTALGWTLLPGISITALEVQRMMTDTFDSHYNTTTDSSNNITEGTGQSANLFYTDTRARGAISLNAGNSGATYTSATGVLDLSALQTTGGGFRITALRFVTPGNKNFAAMAEDEALDGSWGMTLTLADIDEQISAAPTYTLLLNGTTVASGTLSALEISQSVTFTIAGQGNTMPGASYEMEVRVYHGTENTERHIIRSIPASAVNFYYGFFAESPDPTKVQALGSNRATIAGENRLEFTTRVRDMRLWIFQPVDSPDITYIAGGGFDANIIDGFTKNSDMFGDGSYDGWESENVLMTPATGETFIIRR